MKEVQRVKFKVRYLTPSDGKSKYDMLARGMEIPTLWVAVCVYIYQTSLRNIVAPFSKMQRYILRSINSPSGCPAPEEHMQMPPRHYARVRLVDCF